MKSDKEIKKEYKRKAQKEPEKNYPTQTLKDLGFARKQCSNCQTFFWTLHADRKICGDANCEGQFLFIGNSPAKKQLDYIETWKQFAKIHKKLGYTPIDRYPIVARWREDVYWVNAGIYNYQPHIVSGEVEPPANPLVEPQFCVRFNDIDNVGITGAHYVGFVMMGEHAFMPPKKFDINQYMGDHLTWLNKGMGLSNEDITLHEDAWAGGGNFGPSMEFFSRGLELSNQVYMTHEATPGGIRELKLKVLDMGQGQERVPWFTQGETTSYETTFPTVIKRLKEITGISVNAELIKKFLPLAATLNVDEVEDMEAAWDNVAKNMGLPVGQAKQTILPLAGLYSVAEHSRALLVALNDGALPSNVGGGYNLRVIYRRAQGIIEKNGWDIHLPQVCSWHADYLKPMFPELRENLKEIEKILDVEKSKYHATKQKTASVVAKIVKTKVTQDKLYELYDSQGIPPELVKQEAAKLDVKIDVPEDFYARVSERHEQKEQVHQTKRKTTIDVSGVVDTEPLYYFEWKPPASFKAKVVKIIEDKVVLDKTWFYPTSGGQIHDVGTLGGVEVVDIFKQGAHIIHVLKAKPSFKEGDEVEGVIDQERRKQLAQHHTTTHIINGVARKILGNHINQASAKKTLEKAHIDLTHYELPSAEQIEKIEQEANKAIGKDSKVNKFFLSRGEAEKRYGMAIYQGGAVPGKEIRIVDIAGLDIEACGGTHLNSTGEAEKVKIIGVNKVSDGVVRLTFVAGNKAKETAQGELDLLEQTAKILGVPPEDVMQAAQNLFSKWKKAKKLFKKKNTEELQGLLSTPLIDQPSKSRKLQEGEIAHLLAKTAEVFSTQKEHIPKTAQRFLKDLEKFS